VPEIDMIETVESAGVASVRSEMSVGRQTTPASRIHEDWIAVILGAASLLVAVLGIAPALPALRWGGDTALSSLFRQEVVVPWLGAGFGLWVLSAAGLALQGGDVRRFTQGFALVFALAWCALVLAGHTASIAWGLEYVIFALALGLLVSHLGGALSVVRAAASSELFIKTGLVLMGATILFSDVVQAGVLGFLQALGVVIVVWYVSFWLASRFRVDEELAVMLSTAVSICGVSAAIAACGAIQGDRRKLSYVTSLVLIVAVPMIILMPWVARLTGIPDIVAGAWMGGTLDTTGAVAAAGALVSDTTMKVSTIVKFSQNVLIGVAALALSMWWSARRQESRNSSPGLGVIWERFPKFVIGVAAASLVFSFVLTPELVKQTSGAIGSLRMIWFALAFVSIGLEAHVSDLLTLDEGRPLVSFLLAQTFNVIWTLLLAWLIFGGLFLATPVL
jgi:uncharacterized membrane protein YadS